MSANTWSREQILCLIEAYRKEQCLYAIKSKNYHNKHLRNEAQQKVHAAVLQLRPGVNLKECMSKMYSLRTQFNIENSKRRTSMNKSGNGANDVYKPNLWYFHQMFFLDEHYVPRKNQCSKIGGASTHAEAVINKRDLSTDVTFLSEPIDEPSTEPSQILSQDLYISEDTFQSQIHCIQRTTSTLSSTNTLTDESSPTSMPCVSQTPLSSSLLSSSHTPPTSPVPSTSTYNESHSKERSNQPLTSASQQVVFSAGESKKKKTFKFR